MEISIKELAQLITRLTGFEGKIVWNTSKPDGQPRRRLDITRAWQEFDFGAQTSFEDGLYRTVEWHRENRQAVEIPSRIPSGMEVTVC